MSNTIKIPTKNYILALVGPSGVGKTSLAESLAIPQILSSTSRKPRPGETDKSYHFLNKDFFESHQNDFVEMIQYDKTYYGILKEDIENVMKNHRFSKIVVEWNGVRILKELYKERVIVIYIDSPYETIYQRLENRGENQDKISDRMKTFKDFDTQKEKADYLFFNDNYPNLYFAQKEFESFVWNKIIRKRL